MLHFTNIYAALARVSVCLSLQIRTSDEMWVRPVLWLAAGRQIAAINVTKNGSREARQHVEEGVWTPVLNAGPTGEAEQLPGARLAFCLAFYRGVDRLLERVKMVQ